MDSRSALAVDFEIACRRAQRFVAEASELAVSLKDYELAAELLDRQVELIKLAPKFLELHSPANPPARPAPRERVFR